MEYSRLLNRKKLSEEIEHSLAYTLSLIIAPMGYGKTTVVHELLESKKIKYIWLHFEVDESSPKYIWDTFAKQLYGYDVDISEKIREMGFPYTTPQRNHFARLIESIVGYETIYIVIDDYQYNHSSELDQLINLLVRNPIRGLKFIILSRTTPLLEVTELILKGFCYRLTVKSFTLTKSEVAKLYRINRVAVTNEMIEETYEKSEGWISAVQLLIQRYKEEGHLESVGEIKELIELTLMKRLTVNKNHLAVLGIMENFSLEQLSFILGNQDARFLIDQLMEMGAFIRYDRLSKRYVVHNIFMTYIYETLFMKLPKIIIDGYYKKLGEWYIESNYIMEGIRCFEKSEEYVLLLKEFEKDTIHMVIDYYPYYICDIIDKIPKSLFFQYPLAYITYLHFLITALNPTKGRAYLAEFMLACKTQLPTHVYESLKLEGEFCFLLGIVAYNDVEKMFDYQKTAYQIIGGPSLTTRPDKMPCTGSNSILYMYHYKKGTLSQVAKCIRDNFKYYEHLSGRFGTGLIDIVMAEYYLEIGDIDNAMQYGKRGLIRAEQLPQIDVIFCAKYILARCEFAIGQVEDVKDAIRMIIENDHHKCDALAFSIRSPFSYVIDGLYLKTRQIDQVETSLKQEVLDDEMLFFQSKWIGHIHYGQLLALENKYIELELYCIKIKKQLETFNYLFGYIHLYILKGIAAYHLDDKVTSISYIKEAIAIAKADGIVTSIAEYGDLILPLLETLDFDETDVYNRHLINRTRWYSNQIENLRSKHFNRQSLTSREIDVMTLLCTGKRNADIAKHLYISESAVKKLLSSIYKKMGVKNRTSAITQYEEK